VTIYPQNPPAALHLAAQPAPNLDDLLWREIQMMSASGWTLLQRWPGGADFQSVTKGGFPMWAHVLLLLLTIGFWLPFMVLIELFSSSGKHQWCRLTFDERGQPAYKEIGRPKGR
jgi:hypothetical protein